MTRGINYSTLQHTSSTTTAPTTTAIDLVEAKAQLRVDTDFEDDYVTELINVATEQVQHDQRRQIMTATRELTISRFPSVRELRLMIPAPPLQSVDSITYVDTAGDTQTWDSSKYVVITNAIVGYVIPAFGESYPSAREGENAVTVTYVAGYADAASVPATTKHAIKLMLSQQFEQREPVLVGSIASALPLSYESLVSAERVPVQAFNQRYL